MGDDDSGGTEEDSVWKGEPVNGAYSIPNIKYKFGISEEVTGTVGVEAAFQELHAFIQAGGLTSKPNVIRPGDYIDLEGGLKVSAYGLTGAEGGAISLPALSGQSTNPKLRLIVVGINSFTKNGNNTPHVVFQFADFPGAHRMNNSESNSGGYEQSEMRKYLVPVASVDGSGNFLDGLVKTAGVPQGVLWGPARTVSTGSNSGAGTLTDPLWLPTIWELFGTNNDDGGDQIAASAEKTENQARLEYYISDDLRKKSGGYLLASAEANGGDGFCRVNTSGAISSSTANSTTSGIAPAFCVQ
ncbi:MAG: DUF6273 domain-containing protein [Spirochaetaceae bacterium]|nr:DUF6273 domain-containing protein [Spirochaetaceae bacterium]